MSRPMVSKACDACRRRKVRCSLGQPCLPCKEAGLQCTFLSTRQKRGRKGETANVLSEIRATQREIHDLPALPSPYQFQGLNFTSPPFSLDAQASPQSLNLLPSKSQFQRNSGLLPPKVIELCAQLFFAQLATTVPILTAETLQNTA